MSKSADAHKARGPAIALARKARSHARAPKNPLRAFSWFVALPTVLVYIAICALVLFTLHLMTDEINRIDGDRGRKAAPRL